MKIILNTICFFLGHAWLTPIHGHRFCNRCGKKQERSPMTKYKWMDAPVVVKYFNPID